MRRRCLTSILMVVLLSGLSPSAVRATLVPVNLGQARNYGVLGLENTTVRLKTATINGNVGVSSGGKLRFESHTVNGDIYLDSTAVNELYKGTHNGKVYTNQDMSQAVLDAITASSEASALAATQTFTTIDSTKTIFGNGGLNVINVGTINLDNSEVLTLSGGTDDIFILNVSSSGIFKLNKSTTAIKGAGVKSSQILINVLGEPKQVKGTIDGTILAAGWNFKLEGTLNGALIAGGVEVSSTTLEVQATLNNVQNVNSFVPEPITLVLLSLGSLVLLRKRKS